MFHDLTSTEFEVYELTGDDIEDALHPEEEEYDEAEQGADPYEYEPDYGDLIDDPAFAEPVVYAEW